MPERSTYRVRWSDGRREIERGTEDVTRAHAWFEEFEDQLRAGERRGCVFFIFGNRVERISNGHGTLSSRRPVAAERMAA